MKAWIDQRGQYTLAHLMTTIAMYKIYKGIGRINAKDPKLTNGKNERKTDCGSMKVVGKRRVY